MTHHRSDRGGGGPSRRRCSGQAWAQRPQTANVRVVVKDPSGAVIPAASVRLTSIDGPGEASPAAAVMSDAQGLAVVTALAPGRYRLDVEFAGFEPHVSPEWRIRAGDQRREVTLPIRRVDESVAVGRDPATSASDPNSDRFGNVLSKDRSRRCPTILMRWSGCSRRWPDPAAPFVSTGSAAAGCRRSQIRSIRFTSGMFAAENHGGGMMFVDIATAPGLGPLRGSVTSRSETTR